MKDRDAGGNHWTMIFVLSQPTPASRPAKPALDVVSVHKAHAGFVWATLHRMGVREADLPDMMQEVFVVVHRRRDSFDGSSRVTSWLYGICRKVAAAYRRRPHVRNEELVDEAPSTPQSAPSSQAELEAREAQATLQRVLDAMEVDRRATFVMYEIDRMSGEDIAEQLGIPVGTVYSRVHAARKAFATALAKLEGASA
ncbi:MAG: sigma-70 family RNA polymerase sigma factor [Myxococcota bacterium]